MHNAKCTIGEWAWEGPALSGPWSAGRGWDVTGTSHARGRDEARPSRAWGRREGEGPALSGPGKQTDFE